MKFRKALLERRDYWNRHYLPHRRKRASRFAFPVTVSRTFLSQPLTLEIALFFVRKFYIAFGDMNKKNSYRGYLLDLKKPFKELLRQSRLRHDFI